MNRTNLNILALLWIFISLAGRVYGTETLDGIKYSSPHYQTNNVVLYDNAKNVGETEWVKGKLRSHFGLVIKKVTRVMVRKNKDEDWRFLTLIVVLRNEGNNEDIVEPTDFEILLSDNNMVEGIDLEPKNLRLAPKGEAEVKLSNRSLTVTYPISVRFK